MIVYVLIRCVPHDSYIDPAKDLEAASYREIAGVFADLHRAEIEKDRLLELDESERAELHTDPAYYMIASWPVVGVTE